MDERDLPGALLARLKSTIGMATAGITPDEIAKTVATVVLRARERDARLLEASPTSWQPGRTSDARTRPASPSRAPRSAAPAGKATTSTTTTGSGGGRTDPTR